LKWRERNGGERNSDKLIGRDREICGWERDTRRSEREIDTMIGIWEQIQEVEKYFFIVSSLVQVMVMKGSYSYTGADGLPYTVDWYADETGFHPSAPHLPQSVLPNHPEVAEAVAAQLRFAAEEDAAAAASSRSEVYAQPPNGGRLAQYSRRRWNRWCNWTA
jgi:hypothetical protein